MRIHYIYIQRSDCKRESCSCRQSLSICDTFDIDTRSPKLTKNIYSSRERKAKIHIYIGNVFFFVRLTSTLVPTSRCRYLLKKKMRESLTTHTLLFSSIFFLSLTINYVISLEMCIVSLYFLFFLSPFYHL